MLAMYDSVDGILLRGQKTSESDDDRNGTTSCRELISCDVGVLTSLLPRTVKETIPIP